MNGKKLKHILIDQEKTLAEAVGVTPAFISFVIRGHKIPSVPVLKRIADYLKITVDELL